MGDLVYEPIAEALNGQLLVLLAASAAIAFGALVQGAVGFGMALVAAPLLVLIRPELVPGPLLVSGLALTLLVARRERDSIDLLGVKWGLVGRVPGVAIGAFALALISEQSMSLLVGILSLAGVALGGSRLRITPSPRVLLVAGLRLGDLRHDRLDRGARRSRCSTSTRPGRGCAARSRATSSSEP